MRDMSRQERKIMRRRMANAYLSSVVGISLLLLLIGVALLVLVNAGSVSRYLKESVKVSVLLREDASDAEAEKYKSSILWLPFVKDAHVVTREEGKKELEDMLGEGFCPFSGQLRCRCRLKSRLMPHIWFLTVWLSCRSRFLRLRLSLRLTIRENS